MKKIIFYLIFYISVLTQLKSQYDPAIAEIITKIDSNNLIKDLRILTGEEYFYGQQDTARILSRFCGSEGNLLAGEYIIEELKKLGLECEYGEIQGKNAHNILLTHKSKIKNDEIIIIGAHFDSYSRYIESVACCSGT